MKAIKKYFKRRIWIRPVVQLFFFILVAIIAVNHTQSESGGGGVPFFSQASVHAICPFGGVEALYQYLSAGSFIPKIFESSFILMFIGLLLALFFGPVICGWVCPLGTIQEWVAILGRKLFRRRYNNFVPEKLDYILRYARYIVLALVIYFTAQGAALVFADYDPYFALFHFWAADTAIGALIVLGITLVAALFVERPWCKYLCPYGALLGVFNLFRIFQIKRDEGLCEMDKACDRACPMNITVSAKKIIRDHQCISCMECTTEASCPFAGVVEFSVGGK